jgi:hypothetical protein
MAGSDVPSDIEIAQAAEMHPIESVASAAGLQDGDFDSYGRFIAKLTREKCAELMRGNGPDCRPRRRARLDRQVHDAVSA